MKQINLLPQEVIAQQSRQRVVPVLVVAVLAAAAAALLPWWMLQGVEASLEDQLVKQQRLLGVDAREEESKDAFQESSLGEITAKVSVLNQLSSREVSWEKALTALNQVLQKDIILSTYTAAPTATSMVYKITGEAPSNLSFANFVESLRQNKEVEKVVVEGFNFSPTKGTVAFNVQISIQLTSVKFGGVK
jgi:flagellar basal body-associated protein FliL